MYRRCIGVVHRILSYEKRTSTRLAYKYALYIQSSVSVSLIIIIRWKDMWNTLFVVMKQSIGAPGDMGMVGAAISGAASSSGATTPAPPATPTTGSNHHPLSKQQVGICLQVVTVLNLFITYGDSFLPSPSDYDDLYYEIMRVSKMLDHFYTLAEKQEHASSAPPVIPHPPPSESEEITPDSNTPPVVSNPEPVLSRSAETVSALATLSMLNIKTIITHFSGKVQQWNFAHPEVALTPDVVLRIIKDNYDSLKLKLQENLDFYEECILFAFLFLYILSSFFFFLICSRRRVNGDTIFQTIDPYCSTGVKSEQDITLFIVLYKCKSFNHVSSFFFCYYYYTSFAMQGYSS